MELLPAARRLSSLRRPVLRVRDWKCPSCRLGARVSRRFQSETAKPFFITTPIFYVNASPHVGHLYSMVLADVLKRWQTLQNKAALLCTGTDEHGMKVQRAAAFQDMDPKKFCDATSTTFRDLAEKTDMDHNFFIRTTDDAHMAAVEHFWRLLDEKGYIYQSKHQGWYCVSDETFYPPTSIEKTVDPITGKPYMASVETGNAVEFIEEKNYHFRMTALKDRLLDFYDQNPEWVVPSTKMTEVRRWVSDSLSDLSISRPRSRLEWGVPVPGDPTQTIYVWVDALINYLTVAGFPGKTPDELRAGGWPADVHVLGKDILRFHAVYWPALLMALDLPLPKRILSHAHWTMNQRKMSKSLGNVVNPFFALDRWGVDAMRFYLIHDSHLDKDASYDNAHIVDGYKKTLQGGLGNLLGRVTRPRAWNVRETVAAASTVVQAAKPASSLFSGTLEPFIAERVASHAAMIQGRVEAAREDMEQLQPGPALRNIAQVIYETNKLLTDTEPWRLVKKTGAQDDVTAVVFLAADSLRIIGILLQPFMPAKATELLDVLGVNPDRRFLEDARLCADFSYGKPMRAPGRSAFDGLFPPLAVET